jgi:hypothetical protein
VQSHPSGSLRTRITTRYEALRSASFFLLTSCEQAADEQAAELDRLEEPAADYRAVDLRSRGISEAQARDLRARLKTFAEDWDRPEAATYDQL